MQKYPQYEKEYKISRKVGTVLAEEAHFSYYTSTTFSSSPEELAKQANDHFAKALVWKLPPGYIYWLFLAAETQQR